jgi:hypothetical protein
VLAQQRLWLDEHQPIPAIADPRCETDEDYPINGSQLRPLQRASGDDESMA